MLNKHHTVHDRKHAAFLLAEKLMAYKNSDAVVLAIPHGGVPVGYYIAQQLHLPFTIIACKKIKHPADGKKTIGSVSIDDVCLHENATNIPNDYIYHQVCLNQYELKEQSTYFNAREKLLMIDNRPVILVDDSLTTIDTVKASLRTIKRQNPSTLIFAVPVATPEALHEISHEVDDVVLLAAEPENRIITFYEDYQRVCDEEVRELIRKAEAGFN